MMDVAARLGIEPRHPEPSYLWPRPRYRGVSHAVAAAAMIPLGALVLSLAAGSRERWAAAIFVVAQFVVFTTSASYHRLARAPEARRRMQMADHAMIFVLMAGTWAPICILVLPSREGRMLLGLAFLSAAVGIVLKTFGVDRFPVSANAMYGVLGWAGFLALPGLIAHGSTATIATLAAGGVAYSVGALMLLFKRPDPLPDVFGYHEIWHLCTIAGALCHYAMVWVIAT